MKLMGVSVTDDVVCLRKHLVIQHFSRILEAAKEPLLMLRNVFDLCPREHTITSDTYVRHLSEVANAVHEKRPRRASVDLPTITLGPIQPRRPVKS